MKINDVKTTIQNGGYIYWGEIDRPILYNRDGEKIAHIPMATVERIKKENGVYEWREPWGTHYAAHYLSKEYREHENRAHCRRIAENLREHATGNVYRCPECNHEFTAPDDCEKYRCPTCGNVAEMDEYEQLSIHDYFDDVLDVEYRISGRGEFRSVQIMVAWGGPNIYIDTGSGDVELYWGGERASYPMDSDTIEEIDYYWEEFYKCL